MGIGQPSDVGGPVATSITDENALRLADDLGGKAYCLFTGAVADVEASVDAAVFAIEPGARLVSATVIPQLHQEMRDALAAELRINGQLSGDRGS